MIDDEHIIETKRVSVIHEHGITRVVNRPICLNPSMKAYNMGLCSLDDIYLIKLFKNS
jgi:hypothetical protein